ALRTVALGRQAPRRDGVTLVTAAGARGRAARQAHGREGEEVVSEPTIWFKQLEVGPMENYVYLIGDPTTREAAVIDAAWDVDAIVDIAEAEGYRITHDLVTHFHPDHLGGHMMGMDIIG